MNENAITRIPQVILVEKDGFFERLYRVINTNALLMPSMKFGLESELRKIEGILKDGEKITYRKRCLLICHLRNIRRLSPFTADVLIAALASLPVMRELTSVENIHYFPSAEDMLL